MPLRGHLVEEGLERLLLLSLPKAIGEGQRPGQPNVVGTRPTVDMSAAEIRERLSQDQVDQQMVTSLLRQLEEAESLYKERVQRPAGGRGGIGNQRASYGIGELREPSRMPGHLPCHSLRLPPPTSGGIPMLPLFANPPASRPVAKQGGKAMPCQTSGLYEGHQQQVYQAPQFPGFP